MVKYLYIAFVGILLANCGGNSANEAASIEFQNPDSLNLIPYPQSVVKGEGFFELNEDVYLDFPNELSNEGNYLKDLISKHSKFESKVNIQTKTKVPRIRLDMLSQKMAADSYSLEITDNSININAKSPENIMHGIQTLHQLFVPAFHQKEKRDAWYLPCVTITDSPKFAHRGLLLDVCRHFFDKEIVLKYIDALAFYKMNVLHLHLTEDQGWRMPIEKYPLLNEISSWRLDSNGNQYGGFYTKEALKAIVTYAKERHITVIPEIELPGHSQAALAAYPQFSCNGGPIEVADDWGVFKEIYCAGNDSTFIFIENILTEVMEIFPSEYIHIGGDEAPKFRWEHCSKCQKRMKDEGLADEHELQSYFIRRIEKFLNENGRKLIGWDEILEGGLSETAAVQSWRGMDGGKEAAEHGNKVIMSPTSHCYLDYSLSSIDLEKVYAFDPIPSDLDSQYQHSILGGECNMWTERVPNEANLDSKVFPRMIALAEVLWSYPEERDFNDFYRRLQTHYPALESLDIQYGLETIGTSIRQEFKDSTVLIHLDKNLPDLTLRYKWQNESELTDYTQPLILNKTGALEVQAYKNDLAYGEPIAQSFAFHKGINKPVQYEAVYNQWYQGKNLEKSLTDGMLGSEDFRDGNWQGFWGENGDFIIDLGEVTQVTEVSASFYQYANSWIFLPSKVEITHSTDGELWSYFYTSENKKIDLSNRQYYKIITGKPSVGGKGFPQARYIRLQATNVGKVPEGHEAAGQDAWLFIDEIIIK